MAACKSIIEKAGDSDRQPFLLQSNTGSVLQIVGNSRSQDVDWRSVVMIRKLKSGKYRLYSEKKDPKTGKRRNLGTFDTREAAKKHEKGSPVLQKQKVTSL